MEIEPTEPTLAQQQQLNHKPFYFLFFKKLLVKKMNRGNKINASAKCYA